MSQSNYKGTEKVSIVVTCYNYGKYLEKCVRSIESQTYTNIEVIIINDGSTDNSDAVAKKLASSSKHVRYVSQDNGGIVKARNRGIEESKGDFMIQVDADDYLEPDYVGRLVQVANKSNADIVYADYKMFGSQKSRSNFPEFSLEELKNHNYINVSSLIRMSSIGSTRFDEALTGMTHEDWDFFLNLCVQGATAIKCHDTHLNYRIHADSRNNKFSNLVSQRKYIDVYAYVVDKHTKNKPAEFSYLAGRVFSHWYADLDNKHSNVTIQNSELKHELEKLLGFNRNLQRQLDLIRSTKLYRLYSKRSMLRRPRTTIKSAMNSKKTIQNKLKKKSEDTAVEQRYATSQARIDSIVRDTTTDTAVVVHLYYPELLGIVASHLSRLKDRRLDVYITVAQQTIELETEIHKKIPNAYIFSAPNRGRDVLPFLWVTSNIKNKGYKYLLKIHTKKSKHRTDGNKWFEGMMDDLLPDNKKAQDTLFKTLSEIDTGIIGPTDVYYPLTVNFPANKKWLINYMSELYGKHNAHVYLYDKRSEFGFFGGTMFWARFDAIETLLQFRVDRFEIEAGQVDGTYAHAQERLFCLIPEVESRKLYEVSNDGVKPRAHKTANVPDWSEDHYK